MKKLVKLSFVALCILLLAACNGKKNYSYTTVDGDPINTRIYTLENGLTVYMSVNHDEPKIQTYIATRVGGKDDPANATGVSHYFEHLMFKGSTHFGTTDFETEKPMLDEISDLFEKYRSTTDEAERAAIYHAIDSISYEASKIAIPNEYDKLMSIIGAEGTNAYTSYDCTVYVENIPSNQVENWLKIEADRFENFVVRGFHTELETIYEEKNMSLTKDSRKMYEAYLTALYPNHPYGKQTVLGTQEHLKNPSIKAVMAHHDNYYVPNNIAICLSGDFDPDEMIALIDKYWGGMKPNENIPTTEFEPEAPITSPKETTVYGREAEHIYMGWRLDGYGSRDADIASLAEMILSNGHAGLIDLDVNQQQRTLGMGGGSLMMLDYGSMIIQAYPKEGQTLEDLRDITLEEIEKLRNGEWDENLIKASINNLKADEMRRFESNQGRADAFVDAFTMHVDWAQEVTKIARLEQITKQDIIDWATEKLRNDNYVIVYKRQGIDPNEQKIEKPTLTPIVMNRDTQSSFLQEITEAAAAVAPIEPRFVDFNKDMSVAKTAKNNLDLLYKQNELNELFSLHLMFNIGSDANPYISIASDYLDYLGSTTRTAEEIATEMYDLACTYSISVGAQRTYISINGLAENMDRALDIVHDLIENPQPNEMVLSAMKFDIIKNRADRKHNQQQCFSALRNYMTYGKEAIARRTLSNEALIATTSDTLLNTLKALLASEHTILYYGPASIDELNASLSEHHPLPEQLTALNAEPVRMMPTNESKVYLAQYDANQIYYYQYSNRGETFDAKYDADLEMYNEYFGGSMGSIVFQEMREARGLAYSAQAFIASPSDLYKNYYYGAFIATQNDKMRDAIEAFAEIINNMPESQAAFDIAKTSLLSRIRTSRTLRADILWNYIYAKELGIDYDRDKDIFDRVQNMTLEDVVAAQQKWAKNRTYQYGVLGDASTLDLDYLRSLGELTILPQEEYFGY